MGVTLKPIVCMISSHYLENYYKPSKLKNNYMEDVENNLFRKKAKVKPRPTFFYSERLQMLIERIHPKILTILKTLFLIAITIFVLPIVTEDTKSPDGYFQLGFALVSSVLATLISNAEEILDTKLSSLTVGKFIAVLLFYKILCRLFFSYEKNTPD